MCDADLDNLQSLVDKSLVRHSEERFWVLQTIREYARERLEASVEPAEVRGRFADHFMALGEEAWQRLREASGGWLDRLEREHDNLRAALDWLERSGDSQGVLALLGATGDFWMLRLHGAEGRDRVERALRVDPQPTAARARALNVASFLASDLDDPQTAKSWAEEALALHRELGDDWGTALALFALGMSATFGDWERARDCFAESAALFREVEIGGKRWT